MYMYVRGEGVMYMYVRGEKSCIYMLGISI
jgi:hypothetical protein